MPSIDVDDTVFAFLQRNAQPLVDDANAVLRRLLPIDVEDEGAPLGWAQPRSQRVREGRGRVEGDAVGAMRAEAVRRLEDALVTSGCASRLTQKVASGRPKRGPKEQRFVTPRGQVVYLRTRSYDPDKTPFFTMQPSTIDDADWYVFASERRGDVVMPGPILRGMLPQLDSKYRDQTGNYKPTFVFTESTCEMYTDNGRVDVTPWRDAYAAVAHREQTVADLPGVPYEG